VERKCPSCGTWNKKEVDYCTNCGHLISPEIIQEKEAEEQKRKILLRKPGVLDRWFESFAQSKNPLVKLVYYILYSVWIVFSAIVGFVLYMVAAGPG
jgi:methionyl-tRNA synthetase